MSQFSLMHLRSSVKGRILLVVGGIYVTTTLLRWNVITTTSGISEENESPNTLVDQYGAENVIIESKNDLPWWDGGAECLSANISGLGRTQSSSDSMSSAGGSCGQRAWAMGPDQKVVAFTLYGTDPQYGQGLEKNIVAIAKLYPGYLVRLYTDPRGNRDLLCPLLQRYPTLFVCDVTSLPGVGDQLMNIHQQMWRFAPMGDPQVQVLLVRDIDSLVNSREVSAVTEWLTSDTVLHTMRDHPKHHEPILAGMWGVRTNQGSSAEQLADIRDEMFTNAQGNFSHGLDQRLLKKVVWRHLHNTVYGHDSFNCHTFWHSHPWPTKRPDDRSYVGSPVFRAEWKNHLELGLACPDYCRPKKHKDWIFC